VRDSRTVTRPVEKPTTAVPDATVRSGDTVTERRRTVPGTGLLLDMARRSTAASADVAPTEAARSDTAMMAMSVRKRRGIAAIVTGAGRGAHPLCVPTAAAHSYAGGTAEHHPGVPAWSRRFVQLLAEP
jgi:hypothetical protein